MDGFITAHRTQPSFLQGMPPSIRIAICVALRQLPPSTSSNCFQFTLL